MRSIKLICVVAFCFFALGAGTAQAREWKIKGKALEELKIKSETIKGKTGTAKIVVAALKATIECTSGSTEGLSVKTAGQAEGSIALTGCSIAGNKSCTVQPITLKVFGELAERNGAVYLVFRAQAGPLTTILISGGECPLPAKTELTGNLAAEAKGTEKAEQTLSFTAATAEGAEAKAGFGKNAATFEASLTASLSGAHAGEAWGFFGAAGMMAVGGGTELDFTGMAAGAKKAITAENVGWSLSNVTMEREWIEEGGVKTEAHFKIIAAPGAQPCAWPPGGPPFETLAGAGAKCDIGIEFVSGTAGRTAKYVLEYGPYIFWAGIVKFPIKS